MQARIACPNCHYNTYLPYKITEQFGGLRFTPVRSRGPAGGQPTSEVLAEKLASFFIKGVKDFTISFERFPPTADGRLGKCFMAVLAPKLKMLPSQAPQDNPHKCPDCGNLIHRSQDLITSVKPLGFMLIYLALEEDKDRMTLAAMFPDGVDWKLVFKQEGDTLILRSDLPQFVPEVETPINKGTPLEQLREQAIMDGITGAGKMTADQINAERAKLAKV